MDEINVIAITGRLTRDPELRFITGSGKSVANFSIAVDDPYDKNKEADFFRIVVWGKQAESVAQYKHKGDPVGVTGRLTSRSYEAANGETKYVTEIIASNVDFLYGGNSNANAPDTGNVTEMANNSATPATAPNELETKAVAGVLDVIAGIEI